MKIKNGRYLQTKYQWNFTRVPWRGYTSTIGKSSMEEVLVHGKNCQKSHKIIKAENYLEQLKWKRTPGENKVRSEMLKLWGKDLLEAMRVFISMCIEWDDTRVIHLEKCRSNTSWSWKLVSFLSHRSHLYIQASDYTFNQSIYKENRFISGSWSSRILERLFNYRPHADHTMRKQWTTSQFIWNF